MNYSVYALLDPRTLDVRYIGSSRNVNNRYRRHVSDRERSNLAKQAWIDELKGLGLRPILHILEDNLDRANVFTREKYWIQIHLEEEDQLLNMRDAELLPIELRV